MHLTVQGKSGLTISHQKMTNVTWGGGVEEEPEKCHVLFEWPLSFTFEHDVIANFFDDRKKNLRRFDVRYKNVTVCLGI